MASRRPKNDILQGTLTLLVLRAVDSAGPMHGYAITARIQRAAGDLLRVEEGSLYPALHRLEQEGWLKSSWGTTEMNRQARVYDITSKGRQQLEVERESWARLAEGVSRVLRYA
jgi:transcriptional regulator